jgi:hypothetical protein
MTGFIGTSITITINNCLRLAPFLIGLRMSSLPPWRMTNEESLPNEFCWASTWVESYVTTDGPSANLPWNKASIWWLRPDYYYCQTVAGLLMWGALSDERMGMSFTISAGPRQGSHSRVQVPWDSRPYFTLTDSRLPLSSPPTTCRATVEVIDPASTRELLRILTCPPFTTSGEPNRDHNLEHSVVVLLLFVFCSLLRKQPATKQRRSHCWLRNLENMFIEPLSSKGLFRF